MSGLFFRVLFLCLFLALSGLGQTVSPPNNSSNLFRQLLDLPAPIPLNPFFAANEEKKTERPAEFFSDENVPPDNAPIEDLIDYWASQNSGYETFAYQIKPSDKTLDRIFEYCEGKPEAIREFLSLIPAKPEYAEKIKGFYDRISQTDEEKSYVRNSIRDWLKTNSKYYVEELLTEARGIRDNDRYIESEGKNALTALARVDWDRARPIIEQLENDSARPYSSALAKWLIYAHALEIDDQSTAERYRSELQKIVEDKTAPAGRRDLAMDALVVNKDFEGRDEWYLSLFEDDTMIGVQDKGFTGLTTLMTLSPPKKWTDSMLKLLKSPKVSVRSAAARNLLKAFRNDQLALLEAMLPWLNDPEWIDAPDNQRSTLITTYGEAAYAAAVPGLILVVQNEDGESRGDAARSLIKFKDSRAIPALRFALQNETQKNAREAVIGALIACGGLGDDEQMSALEAYAVLFARPGGVERLNNYTYDNGSDDEEGNKPLPLPVIVGKIVSEIEEPSEGLAARAIAREKALRKIRPEVARVLADVIRKWKSRVVYLEMLRRVQANEADENTILTVLAGRQVLREKVPAEIVSMRMKNGAPRGIGACIAEEPGEYLSALGTSDAETQIALLSCARLVRAPLPVEEVGALLKSANVLLALAAERYLETEDSARARTLVLSKHPNEAVILGARAAFVPAGAKSMKSSEALDELFASVNGQPFFEAEIGEIQKFEESLRTEIKANGELLAIYAHLPEDVKGQEVIRVYQNRIVLTFYEDEARYWEKNLTGEEYEKFYRFLLENNIDGLSAYSAGCDECETNEFVMFGRNGGRRVFFRMNEDDPPAIANLRQLFASFRENDMRLRYKLADKIKNLEVLLVRKDLKALSVWKKDGDFRVLIEDEAKKAEIEKNLEELERAENAAAADEEDSTATRTRNELRRKRREDAEYAHFAWRQMIGGQLGGLTTQPAEAPYLPEGTQLETFEDATQSPRPWQVRAGNFEIRAGSSSLLKITRGQGAVKLKQGNYWLPVVSADGKWVVVTSQDGGWGEPASVSRVNIETGRVLRVNVPPANTFMPVTRVTSQNKILLFRAKGRTYRDDGEVQYVENDEEEESVRGASKTNPSPKVPEYYLLDPATGAVELVKGEFRPLEQQTYRPLQPTGNPNEFWAAVYDEKTKQTRIGRYSEKAFSFQPVLSVPDIHLTSTQIWVDEKEAKVYFVYQGHLLALPLK